MSMLVSHSDADSRASAEVALVDGLSLLFFEDDDDQQKKQEELGSVNLDDGDDDGDTGSS